MGIGDLLMGKGPTTLHGIKRMHRGHDVRGLVQALDVAPANLTPYILEYLDDMDGDGYLQMMVDAGFTERFNDILENAGPVSRRRAVSLLVRFISSGKGSDILTERNTTHLVRMLHGADDDLRSWITYCLPPAISKGHASTVSIEGGIEELVDQLDTYDPHLICYSIAALECMEGHGYQADILRLGVIDKLMKLRVMDDQSVRSYSDDLYFRLTKWKDSSSRIGNVIPKPEKEDVLFIRKEVKKNTKEEALKKETGENRYVRPKARDPKNKKKRKALGADGRPIERKDENETMEELPDRSTKQLKDRITEGRAEAKKGRDEGADEEEVDFEIVLD